MDPVDVHLLRELERGLPFVPAPYEEIGKQLGLSDDEVPVKFGGRASDGLLWIGTRESLAALKEARGRARARGVYDDPSLSRGGYDFLANDSSLVISRTGKWLDDWIAELPSR